MDTHHAPEPPAFYSGLDLGQLQDHSALVVVERTRPPGSKDNHFAVRHIHRWPLMTGYPGIVSHVRSLFAEPPLKDSTLVIDRTGVGVAVTDQFRDAGLAAELRPYSITAGRSPSARTVPKVELVGVLQTLLGTRRLKIASALPFAETLVKELELFRVKVTADRNETFESWRERDHDDLVLALALACWYGNRPPAFLMTISI
jgi:hypothetical protein